MGSERRQSLIDVELARTEFRLDVIKLREQLGKVIPSVPKRPAVERVADTAASQETPSASPNA
jgi:hypothetical protein